MAHKNPERKPRLLPLPDKIGQEPDAFAQMSPLDQEELASLVYLSNVADTNTAVTSYIQSLNNSIYTQAMNSAGSAATFYNPSPSAY